MIIPFCPLGQVLCMQLLIFPVVWTLPLVLCAHPLPRHICTPSRMSLRLGQALAHPPWGAGPFAASARPQASLARPLAAPGADYPSSTQGHPHHRRCLLVCHRSHLLCLVPLPMWTPHPRLLPAAPGALLARFPPRCCRPLSW